MQMYIMFPVFFLRLHTETESVFCCCLDEGQFFFFFFKGESGAPGVPGIAGPRGGPVSVTDILTSFEPHTGSSYLCLPL